MMYFINKDKDGNLIAKVASDTVMLGMTEVSQQEYEATTFPELSLVRVYTGMDAVDAMSEDMLRKGKLKDALRVIAANDVREVKSKLKRIADANGVTVADLVPGIPVT